MDRMDTIIKARESCSRNLDESKSRYGTYRSNSAKSFLLRSICAIIIFTAIIIIDNYDFKYKNINSTNMKELVNTTITTDDFISIEQLLNYVID